MRLWFAILAMTLPACGFNSNAGVPDAPPKPIDAPPDAAVLAYGTIVTLTFDSDQDLPAAPRTISSDYDIDTNSTNNGICDQHNNQKGNYCVFAGKGFTIDAGVKLSAHGDKPVVLLSTSTFTNNGTIDVASHIGMPKAAAANPADCIAPLANATGAAGAAGGSFATKGGDASDAKPTNGVRGLAGDKISMFPRLRGGCPGGNSGVSSGGKGGDGGGAVAIVSPVEIVNNGNVNASGSPGNGGPADFSGGGGGGAGGMIILDAPKLTLGANGKLWANGGGGAQGGTTTVNNGNVENYTGVNGNESGAPDSAAAQTTGETKGPQRGGNGGKGAIGALEGSTGVGDASTNNMDKGGGGGGGGGVGFIRAPGLTNNAAKISPSLTP